MRPTFNQTVNVLVQAYLNDTLEHSNCYACAVGNIIAAANGFKYTKSDFAFCELTWDDNHRNAQWYDLVLGTRSKEAIDQATSTGYSVEEIIRIEAAFECVECPTGDIMDTTNDQWMYDGLMAVVDVLAEIHGVSLEHKEEAKLLFV
jgi:hypothetical protein